VFVLSRFTAQFGKRDLASISQEEVLTFLFSLTKDNKQATKRNRYSVLHLSTTSASTPIYLPSPIPATLP
jgi:hypothetical protein